MHVDRLKTMYVTKERETEIKTKAAVQFEERKKKEEAEQKKQEGEVTAPSHNYNLRKEIKVPKRLQD